MAQESRRPVLKVRALVQQGKRCLPVVREATHASHPRSAKRQRIAPSILAKSIGSQVVALAARLA